jgi:hypothetical protein
MELIKKNWRLKTRISPDVAAGSWQKPLSLCEWLFKVVKVLDHDLNDTDHTALFELREAIRQSKFYQPLRTFLSQHQALDVEQAARHVSTSGMAKEDDAVFSVLKEACAFLVDRCSILCTTPVTSQKPLYREFKESAKAVAILDADNVTRPEAVLVLGDKMRPCVMGGFPPYESPLLNMPSTRSRNPLYADLNLSILAAHVKNGFFHIRS